MRVSAYAPATIANFIVGFDLLGAAIQPVDGSLWGDIVSIEDSDSFQFEVVGPYADKVSDSSDNLVLHAFRALSPVELPVKIVLEKNLPVNSGLGSSASSIVASLKATQAFLGINCPLDHLVGIAAGLEGVYSGSSHFDNVSPAFRGGLVLEGVLLPWDPDLVFVVVHPDYELPTRVSREALPALTSRRETLSYGRNLSLFVHALHTQNWSLLGKVLRDTLAEPYRANLVPGFRNVQKAALEGGALGCSFSGSGPTVFAICESRLASLVATAMTTTFSEVGLASTSQIMLLDPVGSRMILQCC